MKMLKKSLFYWVIVFVLSGVGSAQVFAAKKYPASDFTPVVIYQNDEIKKNALIALDTKKSSISSLELFLLLGFLGFMGFLFKSTRAPTVPASALTVTDDVEDIQVVDNIEDLVVVEEVDVTEDEVPADSVVETTPVVVVKRKRYGYQGKNL
jgi:hypothetical protein